LSYAMLITGPRHRHDLDGPEALHVVIMDNGRSAVLRSENREALYCLRCGACLNVCLIYRPQTFREHWRQSLQSESASPSANGSHTREPRA
jgi:L-lactate utilization protein LutB